MPLDCPFYPDQWKSLINLAEFLDPQLKHLLCCGMIQHNHLSFTRQSKWLREDLIFFDSKG